MQSSAALYTSLVVIGYIQEPLPRGHSLTHREELIKGIDFQVGQQQGCKGTTLGFNYTPGIKECMAVPPCQVMRGSGSRGHGGGTACLGRTPRTVWSCRDMTGGGTGLVSGRTGVWERPLGSGQYSPARPTTTLTTY